MTHDFLQTLGIESSNPGAAAGRFLDPQGPELVSLDPATNEPIASVRQATSKDYEEVVSKAQAAFEEWRLWPAPKRGEVVRQVGEALREKKDALGKLVTLEMGKILPEGLGEVQEMIDICDFAVGLSRQLYGLSMHSERPGHRMYEQWHPLGTVGCITAFNFPVAVWAWNAMIAFVCGDSVVWKPSELTPLTAVAVQKLTQEVFDRNDVPEGLSGLLIGELDEVGKPLVADARIPLISATGSCRMGKQVSQVVSARLGRSLLELGGNNAIVVMDDANLDLALRGTLFGAVGTAGQRCTTARRLLLHDSIHDEFLDKLATAYSKISIGHQLDAGTLCGPLHTSAAVSAFADVLGKVGSEGGSVVQGGQVLDDREGNFVVPAITSMPAGAPSTLNEVFVPILHATRFSDLEEAIAINNGVNQGLSSSLFTTNVENAFRWTGPLGSDCGIVNVNIGPSGAEIGGAFGGEKETGGGRESGSDAWKQYMIRSTCTINYSRDLPLAQGVSFDV